MNWGELFAAAPDLMEAAEAVADAFAELCELVSKGLFDAAEDYADSNRGIILDQARAAIAKAKGE